MKHLLQHVANGQMSNDLFSKVIFPQSRKQGLDTDIAVN